MVLCLYIYVHVCIYMHIHHTVNFFTCTFDVHACIHIVCVCVYIQTCTIGSFKSVASINLALVHEHVMQCVCSRVSDKLSPARVSDFQDPVLTVVALGAGSGRAREQLREAVEHIPYSFSATKSSSMIPVLVQACVSLEHL